jgi:LuxR family maltose regulon positive regulatory protein
MDVLLSTKLYPPPAPSKIIRRSRLLARLDERAPLILFSAPPGFGKTTLVAEWRASKGDAISFAWLSLDPDDNDAPMLLQTSPAAVLAKNPIRLGFAPNRIVSTIP